MRLGGAQRQPRREHPPSDWMLHAKPLQFRRVYKELAIFSRLSRHMDSRQRRAGIRPKPMNDPHPSLVERKTAPKDGLDGLSPVRLSLDHQPLRYGAEHRKIVSCGDRKKLIILEPKQASEARTDRMLDLRKIENELTESLNVGSCLSDSANRASRIRSFISPFVIL